MDARTVLVMSGDYRLALGQIRGVRIPSALTMASQEPSVLDALAGEGQHPAVLGKGIPDI